MAPEVRLIGPENEPLGVVSLVEALRLAGEQDVDLVEVVAAANPPVCRLIEYGKFKYHEQKKAAEAKSKQKVIEVKEIKFPHLNVGGGGGKSAAGGSGAAKGGSTAGGGEQDGSQWSRIFLPKRSEKSVSRSRGSAAKAIQTFQFQPIGWI